MVIEKVIVKNLEPSLNRRRGQEMLLQQKTKNYTEFLMNRKQFLESIKVAGIQDKPEYLGFGYKGSTGFWDMQNDITNLKNELAITINTADYQEKFKQLQHLEKAFSEYAIEIVYHDILDHILNGQIQNTFLSDFLKGVTENQLAGFRLYNNKNFETEYFLNFIKFEDSKKGLIGAEGIDKFHLEMINLLPNNEKEKLLSLLYQAHRENWQAGRDTKKLLLDKLTEPEYEEIMDHLTQSFVRGQVFRGMLSLVYEKYNTVYLKMMKKGINIKTNLYLQLLQLETRDKVQELNKRFQEKPESFNGYPIYDQIYNSRESSFDQLEIMRQKMYHLIAEIMTDPLMEKIAREIYS